MTRTRGWGDRSRRPKNKKPLEARIKRLKEHDFVTAFRACAPRVEIPATLPRHICCPLPDHPEETGSCYLQEHRWWCFGCDRGGDILDFVCAFNDVEVKEAVLIAERALGFRSDDLEAMAAVAKSRDTTKRAWTRTAWSQAVNEVRDDFLDFVRPYLRSPDPVIYGIASGPADYAFEQIAEAAESHPLTVRGARSRIRGLRKWARSWGQSIARAVLKGTGRDRLDCATIRPRPSGGVLRYLNADDVRPRTP